MNQITTVSSITAQDVAEYIRLPDASADDLTTLNNMLGVAKNYMCHYTGRTLEELDDYQDFVIVCFVLVQDMWDSRTLYVDSTNLNYVVESILNMHSTNLLPKVLDNE